MQRRMGSRLGCIAAAVVVASTGWLAVAQPASAAEVDVTNGCVDSVPDPGTDQPVSICYTLFRPAGASAKSRTPVIMHSHGWGGSRATEADSVAWLLDAGFGVLSFDQRSFGESGGKAYLENPDVEGKDVQAMVDVIAAQDWVAKDGPDDPVLGAVGGSYGGGYQYVGAFSEIADRGETRFDALAPEITWHRLAESLAPQGVPRTAWALLLYAAGIPTDSHTTTVTAGLVESSATGNFPPSLEEFMAKSGPGWHVDQGRKLDIPVLMRQGATDNLFPLDQALKNFQHALTPKARKRSMLIGYNGGHALPSVVPPGTNDALAALNDPVAGDDPCSQRLAGDFGRLSVRFFTEELLGKRTGLTGHGRYHLATAGGRCQTVSGTHANTPVELGTAANLVGVSAPLNIPIKQGPLTVAGTPTLDADVTSVALDGRMFLSLAVGTSPLDAKIVQNNMLPLREPGPVVGKPRSGVELPSVAVDVRAGETLYLTVSPLSDMSFGHGSRVPGVMMLDDITVDLPLVN